MKNLTVWIASYIISQSSFLQTRGVVQTHPINVGHSNINAWAAALEKWWDGRDGNILWATAYKGHANVLFFSCFIRTVPALFVLPRMKIRGECLCVIIYML